MNRRFRPPMDACISTARRPGTVVTEWSPPGAPAWMDGLRVAFASDFHQGPGPVSPSVGLLRGLRADLVLLGGDFADRPENARRLIEALADVDAPLGKFTVVGNNDREAFPDEGELRRALADSGIHLLVNEQALVKARGHLIAISGVDEARYGAPSMPPFDPSADYRVLLTHYPVLPDVPQNEAPQMLLAGHTHGGQFNFLGLTPYAIGFERLGSFAPKILRLSGTEVVGRTAVLVSKGIGCSRIPLRVGVRSEIHLLRF